MKPAKGKKFAKVVKGKKISYGATGYKIKPGTKAGDSYLIYKITNLVNGKVYIGQTIRTLKERIYGHKSSLKYTDSRRKCNALVGAFKKYGFENFKFETIYTTSCLDDLNKKETEIIRDLDCIAPNGYNISLGGLNTFKSKYVKEKMKANHFSKKPGYKSTSAKTYEIYFNNNKISIHNLKKYCEKNGLNYKKMNSVANQRLKYYRGYTMGPRQDSLKEYNYLYKGCTVSIKNLSGFCDVMKMSRSKMISVSTQNKKQYLNFYSYA